MIEDVILLIQALCFAVLEQICLIFGMGVNQLEAILRVYVEPAFAGTMAVLAVLALCRLNVRRIAKILFWTVLSLWGLLVIVALLRLTPWFVGVITGSKHFLEFPFSVPDYGKMELFFRFDAFMYRTAVRFGTTKPVVDCAIYAILLPTVNIVSYLVATRHTPAKRHVGKDVPGNNMTLCHFDTNGI